MGNRVNEVPFAQKWINFQKNEYKDYLVSEDTKIISTTKQDFN